MWRLTLSLSNCQHSTHHKSVSMYIGGIVDIHHQIFKKKKKVFACSDLRNGRETLMSGHIPTIMKRH